MNDDTIDENDDGEFAENSVNLTLPVVYNMYFFIYI